MSYRFVFMMVFICSIYSIVTPLVFAGDLDDKISKYTEDGISKYDELGNVDKNVKYIKMRAIGRAKTRAQNAEGSIEDLKDAAGQANMNSVILGAGGVIRGDVIIIDESKGAKTQIVDK